MTGEAANRPSAEAAFLALRVTYPESMSYISETPEVFVVCVSPERTWRWRRLMERVAELKMTLTSQGLTQTYQALELRLLTDDWPTVLSTKPELLGLEGLGGEVEDYRLVTLPEDGFARFDVYRTEWPRLVVYDNAITWTFETKYGGDECGVSWLYESDLDRIDRMLADPASIGVLDLVDDAEEAVSQ